MQETQETWVQTLVGKISWSRKWQFTPVFLPVPWTDGPGGLQSMGPQRIGPDWVTEHTPTPTCLSQTFIWEANQLFPSLTGPEMERKISPGRNVPRTHLPNLDDLDDEIWDLWADEIQKRSAELALSWDEISGGRGMQQTLHLGWTRISGGQRVNCLGWYLSFGLVRL